MRTELIGKRIENSTDRLNVEVRDAFAAQHPDLEINAMTGWYDMEHGCIDYDVEATTGKVFSLSVKIHGPWWEPVGKRA